MKTQYKIVAVVIASLISSGAFADSIMKKPTTRIDFNKMIDENNNDKSDLQKSVATTSDQDAEQAASTEQQKVMDFVDVEVGMGQARPVVDRRFNSVGEAKVEKRFSVSAEEMNENSGT